MEFKVTRTKWGSILWGIAMAILGLYMFVNPGSSAYTITVAVGWVLTIAGICALVGAFTHWSVILSTIDLYSGALSLLFGMLILAWPQFFVAWIFILLGIYIIAAGFSMLAGTNALHVLGVNGSGAGMALAVLTIVLGVLVIMSPFTMANIAMSICGIALVYTGIVHMAEGARIPSDKSK